MFTAQSRLRAARFDVINTSFIVGVLTTAILVAGGCMVADVGESVTGSGNLIEKTYDVTAFDTISIKSSLQVRVKPGDKPELVVRADDNVIDLLIVEQENETVYLTTAPGVRFRKATIIAEITAPALKKLKVMGAAKLEFDSYPAEELEVVVGGAAHISGQLAARRLSINSSGAARIAVLPLDDSTSDVVTTEELTIVCSGAVSIDLAKFPAEQVDLKVSGVGKCRVFDARSLTVDASGACHITYFGNPEQVVKKTSGVAKISSGKQ